MRSITVATDGSALNNPKGAAGWAWFVDENRWDYGGIPKGSNQLAEALAIYRALRSLPYESPLIIQTDSKFWVNVLGEDGKGGWRAGWKRRGWIKPDGKPPANLKVLKALDELIMKTRRASVKFEWIRGHEDHVLNTVADKLCTYASFQIREGIGVKGPGWRASSQSLLYPYELPSSARKVLDTPVTADGKLSKKKGSNNTRKATKQEIIDAKSKAAAKVPPKSPVAKTTTSTSNPPIRGASTAKSSPASRKTTAPPRGLRNTGGDKAYKSAVMNPPTASQRAKAEDAAAKRKANARKKLDNDPSVISFFSDDERNFDTSGITPKAKKGGNREYCSSCDGPIDPITKECRCSF